MRRKNENHVMNLGKRKKKQNKTKNQNKHKQTRNEWNQDKYITG